VIEVVFQIAKGVPKNSRFGRENTARNSRIMQNPLQNAKIGVPFCEQWGSEFERGPIV